MADAGLWVVDAPFCKGKYYKNSACLLGVMVHALVGKQAM